MKRALWIVPVLVILAPAARAQFLGDSLAAAGFNITEEEAIDALSAIAAGMSRAGTPDPEPEPPRPPEHQPETYKPIPTLEPMSGTAMSIPASAPASPGDAAEWKSSWREVGTTVTAPPQGSTEVDASTRHDKGVFYRKQGSGWVVIPAPVGARVSQRPAPAITVTAGQRPYLYYNGAFFVWSTAAKAYEVVAAPAGAVVAAIPASAVRKDQGGGVVYEYGATRFVPMYRGTSLVYQVAG